MPEDLIEVLQPHDEEQSTYILVTGANGGLGYAICERLIDDFVNTRPSFQSITIIITTRDRKKSEETTRRLQRHIGHKNYTTAHIRSELLDLTSLQSVQSLASRLLHDVPHLDAVIWNAGHGATTGVDWFLASWYILTDFIDAVTRPKYKLTTKGALAAPQIRRVAHQHSTPSEGASDPSLGLTFVSNVFGHYVLSHLLSPLLSRAAEGGRIILVSSIEAYASAFSGDDIQCLRTNVSYESSKRLTDILALSATLPATAPFVNRFFAPPTISPGKGIRPDDNENSASLDVESTPRIALSDNEKTASPATPAIYLSHPGICATSFVPLPTILFWMMGLTMLFARLLGSPWHTVSARKGANAAVWLTLTPREQIDDLEVEEGRGKWGSACNRVGREEILRTEVEGWGLDGKVKREELEQFEEQGRDCWRQLEAMRVGWEERMRSED